MEHFEILVDESTSYSKYINHHLKIFKLYNSTCLLYQFFFFKLESSKIKIVKVLADLI